MTAKGKGRGDDRLNFMIQSKDCGFESWKNNRGAKISKTFL